MQLIKTKKAKAVINALNENEKGMLEFTDNNKTQLMRDGIEVLINKIPDDTDLKIGQMVCYQNRSGIYAFLGTVTDVYNRENILNYAIDTAIGTYLASELRLLNNKP